MWNSVFHIGNSWKMCFPQNLWKIILLVDEFTLGVQLRIFCRGSKKVDAVCDSFGIGPIILETRLPTDDVNFCDRQKEDMLLAGYVIGYFYGRAFFVQGHKMRVDVVHVGSIKWQYYCCSSSILVRFLSGLFFYGNFTDAILHSSFRDHKKKLSTITAKNHPKFATLGKVKLSLDVGGFYTAKFYFTTPIISGLFEI